MTQQDSAEDEMAPPLGGFLTPLMTVIGGAGVYFLMFRFFVDPMHRSITPTDPTQYRFLWETTPPVGRAAVMATDLAARYAVAMPSVILTMASLSSFVVAFAIVLKRFGRPAQILGGVAALAGAAVGYLEQYNNPVRGAVADCPPNAPEPICPLDQAALRAGDTTSFDPATLEQMQYLVHWNSALSVAACCVLGICFLSIARHADDAGLHPWALRRRRASLSLTLTLAALVLVLSIATTHGYYHYAAALIAGEAGATVSALGSTGTTYWGAVYAMVFVIIALPALFGLYRDIQRAAIRANPRGTYAERMAWCAQHGLSTNLRDGLAPLLTALAPVLTSPLLDALRPYLATGTQ